MFQLSVCAVRCLCCLFLSDPLCDPLLQTLGSEPPQGGIFKGENGAHWRPKKKFVTKTMDEKHNENMFFVFTTIFDPFGLPHPLLKAPNLEIFWFF